MHVSRLGLLLAALVVSSVACKCGEPPAKPTLLALGEDCTEDEACESSLCDAVPGFQTVCTRRCADGCAVGDICEQLTPGRFACVQDRGGLCQVCQVDTDCPWPGDKCLVVDGANVCGRDCAFDQTCPTSYRCLNGLGTDGKSKPQQCTSASGTCTCTAQTAGQTISCTVTNGFGTCAGDRTCNGTTGYDACDARVPAVETCNGVDDDCNGTVDDGLQTLTCGVGACLRTVSSCSDGGLAMCLPGDAGVETCNAIDDDCDGTVDDGFNLTSDVNNCGACNNTCMLPNATPRCATSACQVLTCNAGFGNCDGLHPNGCEANLLTDVNHCNACGNACTAAGATSTCDMGTCRFTCNAGYIDLDGLPGNGCEYQCTFASATDLPDLGFVDANCDGIDGEIGNGIFVSQLGDDLNPGTMGQPKRTLPNAVAAAVAQNKRDVYVSAGSFIGTLDLSAADGKIIAGGYAPPTWRRSLVNTTLVSGGNPAVRMVGVDNLTVQFITFQGAAASGTTGTGHGNTAYGAFIDNSQTLRLEGLTLSAGSGVDGTVGASGSVGTAGGPGAPGVRGCQNDSDFWCTGGDCSQPQGGTGGASSCGRAGGRGGVPGRTTSGFGVAGLVGQLTTPAGLGGTPQSGGSGYATPAANMNGTAGALGADGADGAPAAAFGTISATGYLPPIGTGGVAGAVGMGGGGGGGGGGGCQDWNIAGLFTTCACYTYGSSGGGGGGGGCGGGSSTAGRSGGASIGLFVRSSTVTAQSVSVTTGSGGRGGNGGAGGTGGNGGIGALSVHDYPSQGYAQIGGRGGLGGRGGSGGAGGGGAGGPTLGVARSASATINLTGISFTLGSGGAGGVSPGNAPGNGPTGQALNERVF